MTQIIKANITIEHIRKRPAMYTGSLRFSGFLQMIEFLMDELIDLATDHAEFTYEFSTGSKLRLVATGIKTKDLYEDLRNYDPTSNNPIVPLGIWVIVALSENMTLHISSHNEELHLKAEKGQYTREADLKTTEADFLVLEFSPDFSIFEKFELDYECVNVFLKKFAYLNSNITVSSIEKNNYQKNIFHYPSGIAHLLDLNLAGLPDPHTSFRLDLKTQTGKYNYQVSFCSASYWDDKGWTESFANNYNTVLGGSHVNGVADGIKDAIIALAENRKEKINISRKKVLKNFFIIVAVKGKDFTYAGSTRWTLDVPRIKNELHNYVFQNLLDHLSSNTRAADEAIRKFIVWE
jgi:DNA gyrase/topoisomerase IV subunit B